MLSNNLRLNLFCLEIIHICDPRSHPKNNTTYSKKKQKKKYVCKKEDENEK